MKTSKKPWPLATVFGLRDSINTNPDYQRPPVWTRSQKQLLIDTVLRNYEIPKLYWRVADLSGPRLQTLDATALDRVHAAMLLQANGHANALRALIGVEQNRGPDFLRLANPFLRCIHAAARKSGSWMPCC